MNREEQKAVDELRSACRDALAWLNNMNVTKSRKVLGDKLRRALEVSDPIRAREVSGNNVGSEAEGDCG